MKQLAYDHDNHLLEQLSDLEDLKKKDQFIKQYEESKEALGKKRKAFLDDIDKKIQEKQKIKEKLTQFRHIPLLKDLYSKITDLFDAKIKILIDTKDNLSRILSVVEEAKFCSSHRDEIENIQSFFQKITISQIIDDYKVNFEKLLPHDHLYTVLGKIQNAITAHQYFLKILNDLKDIWPNLHTDEDIVILENKGLIKKIVESFSLEEGNYLSLPSQERAILYQHALKVLGEDKDLQTLTPDVKRALLKTHDAYKKARDAIFKIRPDSNFGRDGEPTERGYLIKGFELTLPDIVSALQTDEQLTQSIPTPPPPPNFPLSLKSPPPPPGIPKAPPPPPGALGPKPAVKALTPWQLEKIEMQKWLDFYKGIAEIVETSELANVSKSKSAQQVAITKKVDKIYRELEKILKNSLSQFDSPNIEFDSVKEKLESLFAQSDSAI